MEWFSLGVYVVGLIIVGWYLKKKNDALHTAVKSQQTILASAEKFMAIFDLEKVEKYVKMLEETFEKEKKEEIEKLSKEFETRMAESAKEIEAKVEKAKESGKFLYKEYFELLKFAMYAMLYLKPEDRTVVAEQMAASTSKEIFVKHLATIQGLPSKYDILGLGFLGSLMQIPKEEK